MSNFYLTLNIYGHAHVHKCSYLACLYRNSHDIDQLHVSIVFFTIFIQGCKFYVYLINYYQLALLLLTMLIWLSAAVYERIFTQSKRVLPIILPFLLVVYRVTIGVFSCRFFCLIYKCMFYLNYNILELSAIWCYTTYFVC